MRGKTLTQVLPFLRPFRMWQRNLFYQISMYFDDNKYSTSFGNLLEYEVCSTKTKMINENSGQGIIYQKNKVDNLKIASRTMNRILIKPGEIFSFCYLEKNSKKYGKYKEGLISINNKIVPEKGGGICHLSNMLHLLFLMSPLDVIERHGHRVKSFPNPDKDSLEGVDATVSSGWLDLKVKNNTDNTYQIFINFDDDYMYGTILTDKETGVNYDIINSNFKYIKKNEKIYESVSVVKVIRDKNTNEIISSKRLYDDVVEVKYELDNDVEIRRNYE